jgi:hypothetical protein
VQKFVDAMSNWNEHPHNKQWSEDIKGHYTRDPEAFKQRGKVKPAHHFEGLTLQEQPEHARAKVQAAMPTESKVETASPISSDLMNKLPEALRAKFAGGKK